jgi:hypothetical protein
MEINPYESPRELGPSLAIPLPEHPGPWKQGKRLVMRLDADVLDLPGGCLQDGDPEGGVWFQQHFHVPGRKRGVIIRFQLGPRAAKKQRRINVLQWVLSGVAILVFLVLPYLAFMVPVVRDNWLERLAVILPKWLFLTGVMGVPVLIIVLYTLLARAQLLLRLHRTQEGFAWFDGAAPQWLAPLREFESDND